ncbi:hypothetical protein CGRA01v4_10739 [Colletotrichum graminicola]|nr:hypothetical protein CGRA01v4_10739 [Colletotrichum graminicola]
MSNALAAVPSLLLDLVECSERTGPDQTRSAIRCQATSVSGTRWDGISGNCHLSIEHGPGHSPSLFETAAGGSRQAAQGHVSQREEVRFRGRSRGRVDRRGSSVRAMHVAARLRWTNPEAWRQSVYGYWCNNRYSSPPQSAAHGIDRCVWRRGGRLRSVGSVLFNQFSQPAVCRVSQYRTRYRVR